MRIVFPCTDCDLRLTIEAFEAGHTVACPSCGISLLVPPATPGPGIILRDYLIEERLARTPMGMAYAARALSTREEVVLTILPGWFSTDHQAGMLFQHEVRTVAPIEHPHIVRVYDGGEDNGVNFLVSEPIDGEDLVARVTRDGPLDEVLALELATRLARALQYAEEEHRVLHRNLSPGCVLMDRYGEPRMANCGLTQPIYPGSKRAAGSRPNDAYRSPEAFSHADLTAQSDIYSLGAVLYFGVTGKAPFDTEFPDMSASSFSAEPMADPRVYNTNLSAHLVALLSRMLAFAPEDRHDDWSNLLAEISLVRSGRPPQAGALPPGASVLNAANASSKPATVKRPPVAASGDEPVHDVSATSFAATRKPWKRFIPIAICFAVGIGLGILLVGPRFIRSGGRQAPVTFPVSGQQAPGELIINDLVTRFSNAVAYLTFHPNDYRGAISEMESFRESARGSAYERDAERALARVEASYRDVTDDVILRLRRESEELASSGRKGDARDHLINYAGRFAADTKAARRAVAAELDTLDERFGDRWKDVRSAVAARVLAEDLASAQHRIRDALAGPMRTEHRLELQAWADTLSDMATLDVAILASFHPDVERTITVGFRTGREYLRIVKVRDGSVEAMKLKDAARRDTAPTARPFAMRDLSDAERFRRLGTAPDRTTDILRGILAMRSGAPGSAAKYFERSETALGTLLAEYIQRIRVDE